MGYLVESVLLAVYIVLDILFIKSIPKMDEKT